MDLPSAYWHIPMHEDSIEKTGFEIPKGKFEMLRMPYGLKNSQATQQRHMDQALKDVKNTSAYVDNILSHAILFKDHISNIRACFKNLRPNNLSLRLDKCNFGKTKIEQCGFIFSEIGMSPSSENIKKIREYPRTGNAKELKRFLGLANYYRDFMKMFAGIAEPLYELLRIGSSFVWIETREIAFKSVKDKLSEDCLLNMPDWNKEFIIELDGSKVAIGGTLKQASDQGEPRILSYHSSTLEKSQRSYSPTDLVGRYILL